MDGWDIAILAIAAIFAVTMLVRMMSQHRDASLQTLRRQFEVEQARLAAERKREKRAEKKRKLQEQREAYMKAEAERRAA